MTNELPMRIVDINMIFSVFLNQTQLNARNRGGPIGPYDGQGWFGLGICPESAFWGASRRNVAVAGSAC
jgi:hypothetical protein